MIEYWVLVLYTIQKHKNIISIAIPNIQCHPDGFEARLFINQSKATYRSID